MGTGPTTSFNKTTKECTFLLVSKLWYNKLYAAQCGTRLYGGVLGPPREHENISQIRKVNNFINI